MATMLDDRQKGIELGADEFVTKPLARDRLARLLRKYLDERPSVKILLVEHDPAARERLAKSLREQGWEVCEAADGREALDRIGVDRPGLILLDLMLPEMDGFEVIEKIRENPEWGTIPIVVITGVELDSEARRRLQGRVEQVLSKSFMGRNELFREIRRLVAAPAPEPVAPLGVPSDA
jgi:CheY-like chemotaxis protein